MAAANALLAALPEPLARLRLDVVDNARAAEAVPVWRADADGTHRFRFRFRFHEKAWTQHPREIFARWVETLPLIGAVIEARPTGSCALNLGDEGHRPGLAFDTRAPGYTLIPDYQFLMTDGYADLARTFLARSRPWGERRPVAFWRGSTTGLADKVEALPRVRLCRLARTMGPVADVGLTAVTANFASAEPRLRAEGLFRDFVPNVRLDEVRVHIDIDGNSGPWTSLLGKLHSGSPVLRVTSELGFRQWYHDRLVPWEHYVPVRSDMADLSARVLQLLEDSALARRIGGAGARFARALRCDFEVARAVPSIVAAFAH
ncbi:glycosyl transferase family 90 [Sphingomonas sp.]|uniref:glycosyl transferase family 90 n=1 Tax=Sphingomonas sp. TaxID=28214 RepID=UPI003AFFB8C7